MKLLKQYQDTPAEGGVVVEEKKGINFAALNGFKGDEAVTPVTTTPTKTEDKPVETTTPAASEKPLETKTEGDAKPEDKPSLTPNDDKKPSSSDDTIESFKIKGEEKIGDEEFSWKALTKRLTDSDIEADTYEAFEKSFNDFKEKIKSEGRQETLIDQISKEKPEVQEAFLLARNGVSLEEINQPAREAEYLLSLSNYDLIKKDFELKGFDPEAIDQKMEKLAEAGEIDKMAGPIRQGVESWKASVLNERTQFINNLRAQEQNRLIQEKQQFASSLQSELKKASDFLGTPLNDKVRDYVVKRFNEGSYDNLRNSPQALMQAILFTEFGDQAVNALKQKERTAALESHSKGLHNVPPVQKGMNTTSNVNTGGKQDPWGALKDFGKQNE